MWFCRILTIMWATAHISCEDVSSKKETAKTSLTELENSDSFLDFRRRRSDCKGTWSIDTSCGCNESYCRKESFREAFRGSCVVGRECYLTSKNPVEWSTRCYSKALPFSATCKSLEKCTDSQMGYSCFCQQGYNVTTNLQFDHSGCSGSDKSKDAINVYAMAAVVVVLLPIAVLVTVNLFVHWRYRHRRTRQNDAQDSEHGIHVGVPIKKCNILIVVDDRDEFKIYSEQLKAALEETSFRIDVERISVLHFCCDGYQVNCDSIVFFLDEEYKSLDRCMETCKTQFLKRRKNSVAVVNIGSKKTKSNCNANIEIKICSVSSINEVEKWLPFVTSVIFNNRLDRATRRKYTYFVDNAGNTRLEYILDTILTSCNAVKSPVMDSAKCKIIVVNSLAEIISGNAETFHGCYVFSIRNDKAEFNSSTFIDISMYNRNQIIKGIFKVLFDLKIIKY